MKLLEPWQVLSSKWRWVLGLTDWLCKSQNGKGVTRRSCGPSCQKSRRRQGPPLKWLTRLPTTLGEQYLRISWRTNWSNMLLEGSRGASKAMYGTTVNSGLAQRRGPVKGIWNFQAGWNLGKLFHISKHFGAHWTISSGGNGKTGAK